MITEITNDVRITVEVIYQPKYSNPLHSKFMFAYKIIIENFSGHTIKLLRRHWYIIDSNGEKWEVEGEGVVGQQPIIEPGKSHQYWSSCHLRTEMGKMYGNYLMVRQKDRRQFKVIIPEFILVLPDKLN